MRESLKNSENTKLKQDDIIELTIEKLVYSGSALARYNGITVFVDGAVPEDTIKARVLRVNKNFIRAKLLEVITPSPHRVKPFCPLFNACGGCNLQNVEYDFLIEQKQKMLEEMFSPKISDAFSNIDFKPFIKAPKLREYRSKVSNAVCETRVSKRLLVGYYKENTHEVTNIKFCPIQPSIIDEIMAYIRENWKLGAYIEKKNKGLLRHILIRFSPAENNFILTLVLNKDFEYYDKIKPEIEAFSAGLKNKFPSLKGLLVNFNPNKTNKITGSETITAFGDNFINQKLYAENGIEYTYKVSADSFFQTNTFLAEKLFDSLNSIVEPDSTILDAYGGVATIGIYLKNKARKITLVEEVKSACDDAKANFKLNDCKNYEVFLGDAKKIFNDFKNAKKSFDYVILDPPRKGSDDDALKIISNLTKKAILYVSCNPSTLARDAKTLSECGFMLKSIQGADMFPFTHHIEALACFERKTLEK